MAKTTTDNTEALSNDKFDLVNVYTDINELPFGEIPTYLEEGVNGVCTGGSALFNVFSNKRKVTKNDLVVIFPYMLVSISEISSDFSMVFLKVPKRLFMDTVVGICRLTIDYFFYMRGYYSFPMCEEECKRFIHFCDILNFRADLPYNFFRRESVMNLLRVLYWDVYVLYKSNPKTFNPIKYTRKEKMVLDFFCLIIDYHTASRNVAFYAEKMCISPKYLTMLVAENSGRSAKEWIVEYTILEIKALLRDSNLEIKEVVSRTRFRSNSTLTRFFREHVGMTPSEYRERIFIDINDSDWQSTCSPQTQRTLNRILKLEKAVPHEQMENKQLDKEEIWINKLVLIMEEHMENTEFNVAMLCGLSGMNQKQLYRKIKELTGITPVSLIRRVRMTKAAQLLRQGGLTVSEVMYKVGYSNPSYFSRSFMTEHNSTPSQYAAAQLHSN